MISPQVTIIAILVMGMMFGALVSLGLFSWLSERRHRAELERLANVLTTGSLQTYEAEVVNAPPDAVARARERIHEDRVSNGIAVLKDRYNAQGIPLSDDEARIQVEAMLMGNAPV